MEHVIPFVFTLLEIGCGIVIVYKFRGTAVGILGGVAFGLWVLSGIAQQVLIIAQVENWWRFSLVFTVSNFIGYGCLLAAFLVMPSRRGIWGGDAYDWDHERSGSGAAVSGQPSASSLPVERVSKSFYLGSYIAGMGLAIVFTAVSLALSFSGDGETGIAVAVVGFLPLCFSGVVVLSLIYKMWLAIQDGSARTTPGKAVGYLFIPIYSFYWIFQALYGWAQDYNRYIREKGIETPLMPEGLMLAFCIMSIISVIPYLGWVLSLVTFIILCVVISNICDGINAIRNGSVRAE